MVRNEMSKVKKKGKKVQEPPALQALRELTPQLPIMAKILKLLTIASHKIYAWHKLSVIADDKGDEEKVKELRARIKRSTIQCDHAG